jgi:hypothetical protein
MVKAVTEIQGEKVGRDALIKGIKHAAYRFMSKAERFVMPDIGDDYIFRKWRQGNRIHKGLVKGSKVGGREGSGGGRNVGGEGSGEGKRGRKGRGGREGSGEVGGGGKRGREGRGGGGGGWAVIAQAMHY